MGRVAEVKDGYLIVESGRMRKSRRPVPREFVHVVDGASKAFVTVPRRILQDAPEVDRRGNFDLQQAALHYGLAGAYEHNGRESLARLRSSATGTGTCSRSERTELLPEPGLCKPGG